MLGFNIKKQKYISIKIIREDIHSKKILNKGKVNSIKVLFLYYIIINLITPIISNNNKISLDKRKLEISSEIIIKINSNGTQTIFNSKYYRCPDKIFLNNNILIGEKICSINLEDEENTIKMKWDDNNITTCRNMFSDLLNITEIDLSNFDTSLVTDMQSMFSGCKSLTSINLSNINTSLVKNMQNMFYKCKSIESLDLSSFKTLSLIKAYNMFSGCGSLTSLNLSNFDTNLVTDMRNMFSDCKLLELLDISNFDTSSLNEMSNMFYMCKSLKSLDLSKFDTSKVKIMDNLFNGCSSLDNLDLSSFNTSLVSSMRNMFSGCNALATLNISKFDLSSTKDMFSIFSSCNSLKSLDLSNFDVSELTNMDYTFTGCSNLTSIDLSNFNSIKVNSMIYTFTGCSSLKFINFTNFITLSVLNMGNMFNGCFSLTSLNLSNFDTSNVYSMSSMFRDCRSLKFLDLSSFNTMSLNSTSYMFSDCKSLISLNLDNFNPFKVKSLANMFSGCSSLTSLNLKSFNTSNVISMENLFANCFSLKMIDLSNFNTEKVTNMNKMFYNCSNLEYINFSNIKETDSLRINNIFDKTLENLIICIDENNAQQLKELMTTKGCDNIACYDNWKENQGKINHNQDCFSNCTNNIKYKYKYENKCYQSCPSGTYNNNYLCEINDTKSNIISNIHQEFYSDNSSYSNSDFLSIDDFHSYNSNSYISQNINYFIDTSLSNLVEENTEIKIVERDKTMDCHTKDFFLKKCKLNIKNNEEKEIFIQNIINEIMEGDTEELISIIVNDKKNIIIEEDNEIYLISTLSNQKDTKYNLSIIDFGDCEHKLREEYHIDENKELIIFKIEHFIEGYNIPIIEYVIFSEDGKIKLNLDYCKDIKILYHIPVSINESELYKYESNSNYYNDKCYPYTTNNGTDITIYDRKNEYNDNNMSLCEENCTYIGYDSNTKEVDCECKIKSQFIFLQNINISYDKLLNKFVNIKSVTNIDIIKCYKLLFSKNGIKSNIGNYLLLSIIFINIIESIIFCLKGFDILSKRIQRIIQINFQKNINYFVKNKIKSPEIKSKKNKIIKKNPKLITSLYFPPKKMINQF